MVCSKCYSDNVMAINDESAWGFINIDKNLPATDDNVGVKVLVMCSDCKNKWIEIYKFHEKRTSGIYSIID